MAKVTGSRYEAVKQGGPFEVAQYELGPPGPNDVLIRNKAVALNPVDHKMLYEISPKSHQLTFWVFLVESEN